MGQLFRHSFYCQAYEIAEQIQTYRDRAGAAPLREVLEVRCQSFAWSPDFVIKEFNEYLRCGILAHGFLRTQCESCQI